MNRRAALKLLSVLPATVTVQRLDAKPGDTLVITYPGPVPMAHVERIQRTMKEGFPGFKCLVIENGGVVSVLRNP
jgi:hypothetical protein